MPSTMMSDSQTHQIKFCFCPVKGESGSYISIGGTLSDKQQNEESNYREEITSEMKEVAKAPVLKWV